MSPDELRHQYDAALVWALDSRVNPHGLPYLATGLLAMNPVWVSDIGTAAVDKNWRLYLDSAFVQALDTSQLAALLVHEVGHLLRDHAERSERVGVTSSTAAWANVCQDAEINGEIPRLPLPGKPVMPLHVGVDAGTPWEVPYLQSNQRPEITAGDCGSGATGGEARSYEEDTHPVVTVAQAERIRDEVAASIMDQHGTENGGWLRWAQERLPSRLDWRGLLQRAGRSVLANAAGRDDRTRSRPSRRFQGWDVVLPGSKGHTSRIAVIVDTSASISAELLTKFLAEVDGLARASGASVQLIENDTRVHSDQLVHRAPRSAAGGGGTDLRSGFEVLTSQRLQPDLIVVCTDGVTPWPERPPVPPVVVVLPRSGRAPAWAASVRV